MVTSPFQRKGLLFIFLAGSVKSYFFFALPSHVKIPPPRRARAIMPMATLMIAALFVDADEEAAVRVGVAVVEVGRLVATKIASCVGDSVGEAVCTITPVLISSLFPG